MTLRFWVGDGAAFMERCLSRLPPGEGVPAFLTGRSDSLAIMAEAQIIDIPPMTVLDPETQQIKSSRPQQVQAHAQYILGMRDGLLLNREGHIATSDGMILVESMRDGSLKTNRCYQNADIWSERYRENLGEAATMARRMPGRYASLVYPPGTNWYHWLVENLGRAPSLRSIPDFDLLKIIVSAGVSEIQRDSLELLGISRSQLIEHDGLPWICEQLYLPSFGAVRASYHPRVTAVLRSELQVALGLNRNTRGGGGQAHPALARGCLRSPDRQPDRAFRRSCRARL